MKINKNENKANGILLYCKKHACRGVNSLYSALGLSKECSIYISLRYGLTGTLTQCACAEQKGGVSSGAILSAPCMGGAYLKRKMVYLNESFSLTYIILEHSAIGIYLTRDLIDTKSFIIMTNLIIFVIL